MEKDKKKPLFIRQPEFPGGPKELTKFVYANLRYPEAAVEAGIEGTVMVEYDIDYQGKVVETRVLQSLGHGCDEEACRVARLLKFDVGKNRGVKVIFHRKLLVEFRKPVPVAQPAQTNNTQLNVQYIVTMTPVQQQPADEKPAGITYNYTIQI